MKKREFGPIIGILIAIAVAAGLVYAGSDGGARAFGMPIFALGVGAAFVIQWIAFVPAYLNKTEAFYDLTGSISYITVMVLAVVLSPGTGMRSILLLGLVTIWAARLGTFLFRRTRAAGEDRRFREIKVSFPRFLLAWTLQGLWVSFSLAAAMGAITADSGSGLGPIGWIGLLVWLAGMTIEVAADQQKSRFKADPANKDKFIRSGLWSWSRHPNYFGEIVLWVGIALIALPALDGWRYLTLISPVFVTILLTRISGVPMLEARADEKWGGQADYEDYKDSTSLLVPMPPSNRS
jgi:steroid 5-alpha reductase family enzyme